MDPVIICQYIFGNRCMLRHASTLVHSRKICITNFVPSVNLHDLSWQHLPKTMQRHAGWVDDELSKEMYKERTWDCWTWKFRTETFLIFIPELGAMILQFDNQTVFSDGLVCHQLVELSLQKGSFTLGQHLHPRKRTIEKHLD